MASIIAAAVIVAAGIYCVRAMSSIAVDLMCDE